MESVQADVLDMEACVLYFVGRTYGQGVSPTGMSKKLSALAFWFKIRGEPDVTKIFLVRQVMKGVLERQKD